MKIKHLLLVALTALALGLAAGGVVAPALAGGNAGAGGGDVRAGLEVEPAIAGAADATTGEIGPIRVGAVSQEGAAIAGSSSIHIGEETN